MPGEYYPPATEVPAGLLDEAAHDALDHEGLAGVPDTAALLDEAAHDALDHAGLTGVPGPEFAVVVIFPSPAAGDKFDVPLPFAGTFTKWQIVGDASGSAVVDVWRATYANLPPTVADTIAGSEKPTLSSAVKNEDASLTSWTTAFVAGDWLRLNVDSASGLDRLTVALFGDRAL